MQRNIPIHGCDKKERIISEMHRKYESMDTEAKRDLLNKRKEKIKVKATSIESRIKPFKKKMREGPYFICTLYNRLLYKKISNEVHKQQLPLPNIFQYSTII